MRLTSLVSLFTCKGSAPKSWWARGLVLAGLLAAGVLGSPVRADTTLNSGTTTVSGTRNFGGNLYVATTGTATLDVIAGGLAYGANILHVGYQGTGTLNLSASASRVYFSYAFIGSNAGSVGTATVSSGTLTNYAALVVGDYGTGTLNVNGGYVSTPYGSLGYRGGVGTVNVSSGTWANSDYLYVGDGQEAWFYPNSGSGTLNVSGGSVTSPLSYIGFSQNSVGTATVSGGTWSNSGELFVGWNGTGTLNVTGGSVTNTAGYVGYQAGVGIATVSSGTWANSGDLTIGYGVSLGLPDGTLNVTGGYVSNTNGIIGNAHDSIGMATVSGGTWATNGNLHVGLQGTGTLTMSGGLVSVSGTVSQGTHGAIHLNSGGTLEIGVGGTTGVLGVSTLTNNGTLIFNRSNASTYTGVLGGSGAVTKLGGGTLTLSGSNTYTGSTHINGGVLAYGASNVLSDSTAVTVAGGGLNLASSTDTVASFTITSGSLFGSGKLTAATYTLGGGTITGNFGGGTMAVTANSNLNGTADVTSLRLNAGTLTLGSAGRFTSNQVALTGSSGGSLSLVGNESVGSLAGAFNVPLGSATLTTGNGNTSTTYAGTLSGSGGLAKIGSGTFTLSGSSSYTGATAVSGGKLLVNGQLGNTAVAVNASGLLGGSGTILGNVTVASSGTLAPGNSPGVFTVGSLSLLAGSHTLMEITGTAAGFYDQIVGTGLGGLTYGSSLNLVMTGSYADGTVFNLFNDFSSHTGNFAAVGLDATGEYAGLTFSDVGGVWTSTDTVNGQRLIFSTGTGDLIVVPEPSTYAMAVAGLACWGWQMFRRRRLKAA